MPLERFLRGGRPRALAILAIAMCLAALFAKSQSDANRPQPVRHPLTGRQIAGIATNAAWMDRREREQEEEPDTALALIGISQGMTVADVGAGTGYMTVRLARLVGPAGRVYATEIQPSMLALIREKIKAQHASNVTVIHSTETDPLLPSDALDVVLLVDVYHELSHPMETLAGLRRAMRGDGRLVLVEYRGEDPTIPIIATHRLSVAEARTEVEAAGFTFDALIQGLPRQHVLIFRPRTH
jgi:predicted methyltransferase